MAEQVENETEKNESHDLCLSSFYYRVQEVSVGTFIGLQILATSVGDKLWKKMYYR